MRCSCGVTAHDCLCMQMQSQRLWRGVVFFYMCFSGRRYSGSFSACEKGQQWSSLDRSVAAARTDAVADDRARRVYIQRLGPASRAARARSQLWSEALGLLGQMQSQRVVPDAIMYSASISACEKGQQWSNALGLLGRMRACEKGHQWPVARRHVVACADVVAAGRT